MLFKSREHAAKSLIPFLKKYKDDDAVILAIPKGGLPIGAIIAKHFSFPLDIVLTKKIGHPTDPEWVVGAISLEGMVVNKTIKLPEDYIETEAKVIRKNLLAKYKLYTGNKKPIELKDKTVIIVDDGVASGNTLKATIAMLRNKNPKKIVIAIPVAPPDSANELKKLVNEFICLRTPSDFLSVGQFYFDFTDVTEINAVSLLKNFNEKELSK